MNFLLLSSFAVTSYICRKFQTTLDVIRRVLIKHFGKFLMLQRRLKLVGNYKLERSHKLERALVISLSLQQRHLVMLRDNRNLTSQPHCSDVKYVAVLQRKREKDKSHK